MWSWYGEDRGSGGAGLNGCAGSGGRWCDDGADGTCGADLAGGALGGRLLNGGAGGGGAFEGGSGGGDLNGSELERAPPLTFAGCAVGNLG